nr:hypothetical protein [uncultured Flavobacterium sp.]
MKSNLLKAAFTIMFLAMIPLVSIAQTTSKKVVYPAGKSGTTIKGVCKGEQTMEYVLSLGPNQQLAVEMKTNVNACYFNLIAPNGEFLLAGEREDLKKFNAKVTAAGDYKIQIYNMRSVARKGTPSSYTLTISSK